MKQADNFNPGQWLVENKLTNQSQLNEMPIITDPRPVPEDIKTFVLDWGIGPVYEDIDEDDWNEGEEMETTIDLDFFDYDDEEYEMCKKIIDFIQKRKGKVTFYDEEFKNVTLSLNGEDIVVNWIQIEDPNIEDED
jgi:hypothetical protein